LLLIAEQEKVKELVGKLKGHPEFSSLCYYNLDGSYGISKKNGEFTKNTLNSETAADGIFEVIKRTGANEVFIAHPIPYDTLVDAVLKLGQTRRIRWLASPGAYESCIGWPGMNDGWILPAVDLNTGNISSFYRIVKRCLDILLSSFALLVFSPLFVVIALLIKLTSRGPVFYTQTRCGLHGRTFKLYKFRSMVAEAEKLLPKLVDFSSLKEPVFKLENDPRVTAVGRILRSTSIDELPQLLNVIKGDLSLVGPRPEEIALVNRYDAYFKERLKAKSGITGLQQITCRGTANMMERMKYDLSYIANQSLWLDLKILFKTTWVVLLQKRTA